MGEMKRFVVMWIRVAEIVGRMVAHLSCCSSDVKAWMYVWLHALLCSLLCFYMYAYDVCSLSYRETTFLLTLTLSPLPAFYTNIIPRPKAFQNVS